MKTVGSTPLLLALLLAAPAPRLVASQKLPEARLVDMYAVKEGDSYVVHVLANSDISAFLSDRKSAQDTYKLTLDVPALSPVDTKYDVQTPFSRRFQIWPMQLGGKVYSRIEIELDTKASSVVGLENASHLFVRIQSEESTPPVTLAELEPEPTPEIELEPESPDAAPSLAPYERDEPPALGPPQPVEPMGSAEEVEETEEATAPVALETLPESDDELFFSLFPTPAREQQTLFNIPPEDALPEEAPLGLRVGRFAVQPAVDFSFIRGDNLFLQTDAPFVDTGYLLRGRVTLTLLDSVHDLKVAYEGRFRDFEKFDLQDRFTSFVDVETSLQLSPRTTASVGNHFVRGAFESGEFDPGGEVVASVSPFYRNETRGGFGVELTQRLGLELNGSFNRVEFLEPTSEFFSYDTKILGGTFLYNLSPLTSLLGEYRRTGIPSSPGRPQSESQGDMLLVGVRGELTPLLRGKALVGFSSQRFVSALVPQDFRGFVAEVDLDRDFGERATLGVRAGRRTSLSGFEANSYYVSNYGRFQFVSPIGQRFRVTATAGLLENAYPVASLSEVERDDRILSGALGLAYFFTPFTYVSVDYRHDQRSSSLGAFEYRNDALQLMLGLGFLSR